MSLQSTRGLNSIYISIFYRVARFADGSTDRWLHQLLLASVGLILFVGVSFANVIEENSPALSSSTEGMYYRLDVDRYSLYRKPTAFGFIRRVPNDLALWISESFHRQNSKNIALIFVSTAALIAVDQEITDISYEIGDAIGLSHENNMSPMFSIMGYPVNYPPDLGSALYYMGDGLTHLAIAGSFYACGLSNNDYRAQQTGSQITEGLISVTLITQLLKHVTGRQSPFKSTEPGGRWVPFPDQIEYHKHVSSYDAFPSGHMAASMLTLTVISENYPEYRYIKPIGFTLMSILGFQMLNNGVHWASDYPFSIAMGYGIGKIVAKQGRQMVLSSDKKNKQYSYRSSILILPVIVEGGGGFGLFVTY